jgi:hypothetical protein
MSEDEKLPAKKGKEKSNKPARLGPKYAERLASLEEIAEQLALLPAKSIKQNPYLELEAHYEVGGSKRPTYEIVGLTEEGEKVLFIAAIMGRHFKSLAFYLGIEASALEKLRKKNPRVAWIIDSAEGLLHDDFFDVIRESRFEPKPMTNAMFGLKTRSGYKDGEVMIAGEKKEGGVQNFNVQIINLPASMSRAEYNKMMDDPERAQKFLDVPSAEVVPDEPDSAD